MGQRTECRMRIRMEGLFVKGVEYKELDSHLASDMEAFCDVWQVI